MIRVQSIVHSPSGVSSVSGPSGWLADFLAAREQLRAKLQHAISILRPDDDEVELRRRAGAWLAHVDRLATMTRRRWQDAADDALGRLAGGEVDP